jgi:hypothetical protein
MQLRAGLALVVVDYLQLHDRDGRREPAAGDHRDLARAQGRRARLNVPVIALSQLNRSPEGREGRRLRMSNVHDCLEGDTLLLNVETGTWDRLSSIRRRSIRSIANDHEMSHHSRAVKLSTRRSRSSSPARSASSATSSARA